MFLTRRAALLLLCAAPAWAQTQSAPEPAAGDSAIRVDVNVVNILCTVRNWRGAYVNDLDKPDFRILEDGQPQEIRYFTRETDTPFTIALLLDVSDSVSRILETERQAAARFFNEVMRPSDQAILVAFAHAIAVWQDYTRDAGRLHDSLMAIRPFDTNLPKTYDAHGGTLLFEAVKLACDKKLAPLHGRKALVIVSDGIDNGSRFSLDDAIRAAQEADAVIFGIHYAGDSPDSPEQGEAALQGLANATGGRSFSAAFPASLSSIFNSIREEMRSQYALGYVSTNRATDGSYRKLTVKTARTGLKVQARQGYYAPK